MKGSGQPFLLSAFDGRDMIGRALIGNRICRPFKKNLLDT